MSKLDDAIKAVNKQFGKGSLLVMSESGAADKVEVFSTGSTAIDGITGIGGIPRGRVSEVYGPEAGGKTTLALQVVATAQRQGEKVVYIDAEQTLDINYAAALGVNVEQLLVSQPECGEDALQIAETMIRSGEIGVVVIDSVAALVPRRELDGEMGDSQMGLQARLMSQAMRKLVHAVKTTGTAIIFINQIRDKLGIMFGSPETTTGGKALKFYSTLRIDLRRIKSIKEGDEVVGAVTKVKIAKNKLFPPYRETEVALYYGRGFVNEEEK